MQTKDEPMIFSMSLSDIQTKIDEYLPVREDKKSQKGEVFTPMYVAEEMLDRLYPSVWKNPELKWLDPANGIGNFTMIVYKRLMKSLPDTYHGETGSYSTQMGKSKHILEKMLYMVEIDKENVKISHKIFGKDANIYCSNFLEMNDIGRFDVIFGNPPYNEGGTVKGGGLVWKNFVFKSLEVLNSNGYLLFIHPTGWRKPGGERISSGDVWTLFRKYNLCFLKMSDKPIPNFPRVDYYLLQKSLHTPSQKTHIISEFEESTYEGRLYLHDLDFIPHFINPTIIRILKKIFRKKGTHFDISRDRLFEPTKSDMDPLGENDISYAFYYDENKQSYVFAYKNYDKPEDIPSYITQSKIIMTYTRGKQKGELYPIYTKDTIGASPNTMYQIINKGDHVKNIMTLLKSRIISFLMKITQYSETPNHKNEYKILNMLAKPVDFSMKNDNDVYNFYGITQNEIRLIENILHLSPVIMKNKKNTVKIKSQKNQTKKNR
jgi:hypothetical protein